MNGDIAPKSIVVEDADLISQWGRQNSRMRHGEHPGGFRLVLKGSLLPLVAFLVACLHARRPIGGSLLVGL